jgi:hypothetical protein
MIQSIQRLFSKMLRNQWCKRSIGWRCDRLELLFRFIKQIQKDQSRVNPSGMNGRDKSLFAAVA